MNARDRRALIWGGTAILGAILVLRVVPWSVRAMSELKGAAIERHELLARSRAVLADRRTVQDSLDRALAAIVALAPKLAEGRSAAEAQAALSSLVSLAAGRRALKVIRLDPLPDSTVGVFNRVALHAELEGDLAGVARLLRAIETADPVLSVTSLQLSATDPAARQSLPEVLRVELNIAGYYLPRGTP